MLELISKLISLMKKEEYYLDKNISSKDLISVILSRIILLLRGILKRIGLKKCGKILFVDSRVKLYHKKHISLGSGITLGKYVEINGLSSEGIRIGNNVSIGNYTIIRSSGSLKKLGKGLLIDNNVGIGDNCFFGAAGGIVIKSNVIMGQNVRFHSENHNFDKIDVLIKNQGVSNKGIIINEDCWIGSGVIFLDGVNVGKGCVIGANTLVNKNIPEYSVVVGNPSKIIKSRK